MYCNTRVSFFQGNKTFRHNFVWRPIHIKTVKVVEKLTNENFRGSAEHNDTLFCYHSELISDPLVNSLPLPSMSKKSGDRVLIFIHIIRESKCQAITDAASGKNRTGDIFKCLKVTLTLVCNVK